MSMSEAYAQLGREQKEKHRQAAKLIPLDILKEELERRNQIIEMKALIKELTGYDVEIKT